MAYSLSNKCHHHHHVSLLKSCHNATCTCAGPRLIEIAHQLEEEEEEEIKHIKWKYKLCNNRQT